MIKSLQKSGTQQRNEEMKRTGITPVSHYTSEQMAKDLLDVLYKPDLISVDQGDVMLDPCSGRNKVFYKNFPVFTKNLECEIEDGVNYLSDWEEKVDWVVSNPPFTDGWKFVEKSMTIARKGIAFLGNHNFINSLFLPSRLELLKAAGWLITNIHVCMDARWFGRYYFVILKKGGPARDVHFTWKTKVYNDGPKPGVNDNDFAMGKNPQPKIKSKFKCSNPSAQP